MDSRVARHHLSPSNLVELGLTPDTWSSKRRFRVTVPEFSGTDCGLGGRVHPQIAWAKVTCATRGRGDGEQEVIELTAETSRKIVKLERPGPDFFPSGKIVRL